uniref:TBC1 domain family, member 10b n=1 Tax=Eptatretus burgeri TaxID=7764 RepID=A0A8C4Q075_EPTBU
MSNDEAAPDSPGGTTESGEKTPDKLPTDSLSGTVCSVDLSGYGDGGSSQDSDSEAVASRVDRFGFLGGNQYTEPTEEAWKIGVMRQRELKWLDMLHNWDKWMPKRYQKIKLRCQKGIPPSLRSRAWQFLSGGALLLAQNSGKFQELDARKGDPKWIEIIERDLHRQFPFHEMFKARGGHGQQDLFRVLKAYTEYRPDEGYCQAQAPVAAVLLMHMPAEQAFWTFVQICDKYLPGYYSGNLEALQLDGETLVVLLQKVSPAVARHLKKQKVDPVLYMTEWFMCVFSRTLPWACVLRMWDVFFCEGVKVMFRVALVLLRLMLGSSEARKRAPGFYETIELLRSISSRSIQEAWLMEQVLEIEVTEGQIESDRQRQIRMWRETKGEMHPTSTRRRLYGLRNIYEDAGCQVPLVPTPPSIVQTDREDEEIKGGVASPVSNRSRREMKEEEKRRKKAEKELEKQQKHEEKAEKKRQRHWSSRMSKAGSKPDEFQNGLSNPQENGKTSEENVPVAGGGTAGETDDDLDTSSGVLDKISPLRFSTSSLLSELSFQETYL